MRVYLLGAAPGVAEQAAKNTQAQWPTVKVVGTYSPPLGFEHDRAFLALGALEYLLAGDAIVSWYFALLQR